jgi:hypothetical protein
VRLFLRLTSEVNDRLRELMRYRGDLSRQIDEALTSTDLTTVDLTAKKPWRAAHALTALVSSRANARLRATAKHRGCTVTMLANSAIQRWLGGKNE